MPETINNLDAWRMLAEGVLRSWVSWSAMDPDEIRGKVCKAANETPDLVFAALLAPEYEKDFDGLRPVVRALFRSAEDLLPLLQSPSFELRLAAQQWALSLSARLPSSTPAERLPR